MDIISKWRLKPVNKIFNIIKIRLRSVEKSASDLLLYTVSLLKDL